MPENEDEQRTAGPETHASAKTLAADFSDRPPEFEPTEFREGFTLKTMLGALFVGFIMMPGTIYLGLVVGQELGPAAEWTTIILFTEVARRSFTSLTRQEIYLIYYMAGGLTATIGGLHLGGGAFADLIWRQYIRQSPAADKFGIAAEIPTWWAPPLGSPALTERTFLHHDWLIPIVLLLVGQVLGRIQWIGLGYPLFRMTSDIERLPYPFAPIQAQGATALAEVSQEKESWRWPVFSVGAMIGMTYGVIYVLVPILTGAVLTETVQLIKIPFIDLTPNTEGAFPAAKIALGTDLGAVLAGFVIPYPIVVGQFISAMVANFIFTPTLYRVTGGAAFPHWAPGMNLIQTEIATGIDFWMSVGIGINVAFAVIGIVIVIRALMRRDRRGRQRAPIPEGRGDFPIWAALAGWLFSATFYVVLAHTLINIVPRKGPGEQFPLWVIIVFGLLWSPLNSYVSARLVGMTGRGISIPYLAQASFILSGYKGVDIWFAPIPLYDYGPVTQKFREIELTGTRFVSVIKAEAFMLLLMLFCSFIFWSFFWKLGPVPSSAYPYAQTFWPLHATWQALWATATKEQEPWLLQALKAPLIGGGFGGAIVLYAALGMFRVPVMWFYGLANGFMAPTHGAIPSFIGAMLSRFYFARRFGLHQWRLYGPVLLAGYACGTGLVGMTGIALAIILKSVRVLPF